MKEQRENEAIADLDELHNMFVDLPASAHKYRKVIREAINQVHEAHGCHHYKRFVRTPAYRPVTDMM